MCNMYKSLFTLSYIHTLGFPEFDDWVFANHLSEFNSFMQEPSLRGRIFKPPGHCICHLL